MSREWIGRMLPLVFSEVDTREKERDYFSDKDALTISWLFIQVIPGSVHVPGLVNLMSSFLNKMC